MTREESIIELGQWLRTPPGRYLLLWEQDCLRAKEGRNPKTGETVSVPPKKVPFFKAGKEMREMVDGKI